ncbi:MAG: GNAT family N-acetyltransferase, partial [Planctomycetota bacterium]
MIDLTVRSLHPDEVDAWCACPRLPGDEGYEDWVAGERAWLEEHHRDPGRLFGAYVDGFLVGKADIPFVRGTRWTFYAPLAQPGPIASDVLLAIHRFLLEEASRHGITDVKCLLEEGHPQIELAEHALLSSGFSLEEERLLAHKDLRSPLEISAPPEVRCIKASTVEAPVLANLAGQVGFDPVDRDAWLASSTPRGWVALLDGSPVGMAAVESSHGAETLLLMHLGVVPSARRRGVGVALLVHALSAATAEGSQSYLGSTATT